MKTASIDLYAVLGVPKGADRATIRAAFRGRMRQTHPDGRPPEDAAAAHEEMVLLNLADETLRDPGKRGSCNPESGHIWFNLELAKKQPDCLEYIVVHEMAHLLERNHGECFTKLMDNFLPDWRSRRDQLNNAPLADEVWSVCAED